MPHEQITERELDRKLRLGEFNVEPEQPADDPVAQAKADMARVQAERKAAGSANETALRVVTKGARAGKDFLTLAKSQVEPKPKLELATPKGSADDSRDVLLHRTLVALDKLDMRFSYDLFRHRHHVGDYALQQKIGENVEHAVLLLRTEIVSRFKFDPGPEKIKAAVYRHCLSRAFNPVTDYLDRLRHDGTPRLDSWLSRYLGAEDNPLNRAIGRKVLIAAVRRARTPGTKFDQVIVLEGPQGTGKSSAIRILAGEYFSDAEIIGVGGREAMELCSGVWLYEVSELEGLGKRDVAHVKAFISRTHDKARPAYGITTVEQGRTCVFIGTTNSADYLLDQTGNRRFWPVVTSNIDLVVLAHDRDQLWAEASMAEATGETLVIDEGLWGEAAQRADERVPHDPWEDMLAPVETMPDAPGDLERADGEVRVSSAYLLEHVLDFKRAQVTVNDSKRLAAVMKRLGWAKPRSLRIGGKVAKGYSKCV